jgi:hypothetical protein
MRILLLLLLIPALLPAAEAFAPPDEGEMFGDTLQVVDSASRSAPAVRGEEAKTIGWSGNVLVHASAGADRDWFGEFDGAGTGMAAGSVGNAALDVRLQRGFRAYADIEWNLDAAHADSTAFRVPESFLDANLGRKVWFRAGKQVLQWGPGYFFNPTDLINVERKTVLRRLGAREGVFGAKAHVPFGTAANLYAFLDAGKVSRPDSLTAAVKAEFLAGRSELALMAWGGGGRDPVYGADLTTRWLGLDLTAEAALHSRYLKREAVLEAGAPRIASSRRSWQPRASLGAGRGFAIGGIPDRITVNGEYYYNHPGSDARSMPFADLLAQAAAAGFDPATGLALAAASGLYEPNSFSRHYAAVFAMWNRFLRSDLALSCNAISNLNQGSAFWAGSLGYRDLNDFGLTLTISGAAGPEGAEYVIGSDAMRVQVLAETAF